MATLGAALQAPEPGWKRIDESASGFIYTGTWTTETGLAFSGNIQHDNVTVGGSVEFKFKGSKLRIIASLWSSSSTSITVFIDGEMQGNFSQAGANVRQGLWYEKLELGDSFHTVKLVNNTTGYLTIDGIDINDTGYLLALVGSPLLSPEGGWSRYENTDPYISYDNGWSVSAHTGSSGGSIQSSSTALAKLTFSFVGTALRIISPKNTMGSPAVNVDIDGVIETYSAAAALQYGVLCYEKTGLPDTRHKVSIWAASGSIWFDAFDINSEGYIVSDIGSQLTTPETGWRRYDDTDPAIRYTGSWFTSAVNTANFGSTFRYSKDINGTVGFKFHGTKLRILSYREATVTTNDVLLVIDGQEYHYSNYGSILGTALVFEITGLERKEHLVELRTNINGKQVSLDAVDIDSDGYLAAESDFPRTGGVLRELVAEMHIGDFIRCGYKANSTAAGIFYRLGSTEVEVELPLPPTNVPYGFFYFIKVAEGLLLADRPIQHGVSWLALNNAGYTQGSMFVCADNPVMTSNTAPYGRASCSSTQGAPTYDAFAAFNGVDAAWGWITKSGTLSGWLEYEFPKPIAISKYYLRAPANFTSMPRNWTLEAWNGAEWIVLDTNTYTGWTAYEEREFYLQNYNKFTRYRINIQKNDGHASYTGIGGLKLVKEAVHARIRLLNGGTSYVNVDGGPINYNVGAGVYPVDNEWDQYFSTGEFTTSATNNGDAIWHFTSTAGEWAQDTVASGFTAVTGFDNSGSGRTVRGRGGSFTEYWSVTGTYTAPNLIGFRPALEYYYE